MTQVYVLKCPDCGDEKREVTSSHPNEIGRTCSCGGRMRLQNGL